jgi:hypothetical protein
MRRILTFAIIAIALAGCAKDEDGLQQEASTSAQKIKLAFRATGTPATRVDTDENELTCNWAENDSIAVFYTNATDGSDPYHRISEKFVTAEGGDDALFETEIDESSKSYEPMTSDEAQNYVMMYPYAQAEKDSLNNITVAYQLGEVVADGTVTQTSDFEGQYLVMRAEVSKAATLDVEQEVTDAPKATFEHLMTVLRLYVKGDETSYGGLKVYKMHLELPKRVFGDIVVDPVSGEVTNNKNVGSSSSLDVVLGDKSDYLVPAATCFGDDITYDNYAQVVAAPFTVNAGDKINVTVYAEVVEDNVVYDVSQTVTLTAKRGASYEAGVVNGIPVKLSNEGFTVTSSVDLNDEKFAPAKDYVGSLSSLFGSNGECMGFHANISKQFTEAYGTNVLILDNTRDREPMIGEAKLYSQSAFYMPCSAVLAGYTGGDLTVTFDAHATVSGTSTANTLPIIIASNHVSTNTSGSDDSSCQALCTVNAGPTLYKLSNCPSGYPWNDNYWQTYTVTIPEATIQSIGNFLTDDSNGTPAYIGFKIAGVALGRSDAEAKICYIKNISFDYAKTLE